MGLILDAKGSANLLGLPGGSVGSRLCCVKAVGLHFLPRAGVQVMNKSRVKH
jgi:hypothetical protein